MQITADSPATSALALVAVLHAGFQVTVTVLVYPPLARLGLEHPNEWRAAHERHSRSIVGLVAVVYVALLAAGVWSLACGPGVLDLLALAGAWGAVLVTGAVTAPTHAKLLDPSPDLLRRMVVSDRWRAVLATLGATVAVVGVVI